MDAFDAGYKGASDMYIDTNVQLAIAAARQVRDSLTPCVAASLAKCCCAFCAYKRVSLCGLTVASAFRSSTRRPACGCTSWYRIRRSTIGLTSCECLLNKAALFTIALHACCATVCLSFKGCKVTQGESVP